MTNMKLHQSTKAGVYTVIRVPGGWIYERKEKGSQVVAVFVPLNNEFYICTKAKPPKPATI